MLSLYELDRDRDRAELDSTEFLASDDPVKADTGSGLPKPRVLVADNNQPMRLAAADILRTKCSANVVGLVPDGVQAIDQVFRLKPDLLVLEIILPVMDGIRVTRVVSKAKTQTKIIILTATIDDSFQRAAFEAGAHGYVAKTRMLTDLPVAVKTVLEGSTFRSPQNV